LSSYIFSQVYPGERERLEAMARPWDPETMRAVRGLGIGAGQRCLEVGSGTGSVARALAGLVGPDGYVLAADRDPRFLGELPDVVEVRRMDVMADDLPQAQFDLGLLGKDGGFDVTYGRRLLGDVLGLGFTNESARYHGTQSRSTSEAWLAWQLLVRQFQDGIVRPGLLTQRDVDEWWSLSRDRSTLLVSVPMFTVQAQHPWVQR
jgi:hypothetical protein